ncbi:ABC transporter substrate-binding protein [Kineococcus gynurae]|uniref:ABC transporter substrate-binding protein n=1 Tax=Kineococcus gynurae TaxID=452979 RepID=A0ABV5LN01_9ACTN
MDRRSFARLLGAGLLLPPTLAACGRGSGGSSGDGIRYAWWGDALRQQNYQKALDLFQDENPEIVVQPEFASYDAFQERMTVQTAGRNVPELFWVPSPQVLSYRDAGLYRRVDDLEQFDLSDYTPEQLELYKLDGQLDAMPRSLFSSAFRYNQTFLEEAGATLPPEDPGSWNWASVAEFLTDYTNNTPDGRVGAAYSANNDMCFEAWVRQHGGDLWSAEGRLGFEPAVLEGWFEWWEGLRAAGAALSLSEQEGPDPEWDVVGSRVLATFCNSNHIVDEAEMYPDVTFQQRRPPADPDADADWAFVYLSRIGLYSGTAEDKLADAATLLDFTLGDARLVELAGLSIGAPANPRVLEEVRGTATPTGQELLRLVDQELGLPSRPRFEAPPGSGTWRTIMARGIESLAGGVTGITETAANVMAEINAGVEGSR